MQTAESTGILRFVHEDELLADPIVQLQRWLAEASPSDGQQPMTLATAGADGRPSARVVLLRGADDRGLVFFTNRDSRKGNDVRGNPRAALVLYWSELGRQVRVEGVVEETADDESLAYWRTRPRASQIAAWASPQSQPIESREDLDVRVAQTGERYAGDDVPLPPFWGGYRVVPEAVEFWTHREDRLHDRIRYDRTRDGWRRERLAP